MSVRVAWPVPFPLGVADIDASLAFCKALDELMVLRLADGAAVWRARADGQPLLVGHGLAIALCAGEVLAFSIAGADVGALRWRVSLPEMPTEADAAWMEGDVAVHWQSRARYRGGRQPGLPTAGNTKSGQCAVHASTGSARPLAEWPARPAAPRGEASDDPSVLSSCVIGAMRYRVTSPPGEAVRELRLAATRLEDGALVWERRCGAGRA